MTILTGQAAASPWRILRIDARKRCCACVAVNAAHDVRFHNTGVKHFHHPVVGELSLSFNRLDLAADHGLKIFTYAAEPGSKSEEALTLLGSWAATLDRTESEAAAGQGDVERGTDAF